MNGKFILLLCHFYCIFNLYSECRLIILTCVIKYFIVIVLKVKSMDSKVSNEIAGIILPFKIFQNFNRLCLSICSFKFFPSFVSVYYRCCIYEVLQLDVLLLLLMFFSSEILFILLSMIGSLLYCTILDWEMLVHLFL